MASVGGRSHIVHPQCLRANAIEKGLSPLILSNESPFLISLTVWFLFSCGADRKVLPAHHARPSDHEPVIAAGAEVCGRVRASSLRRIVAPLRRNSPTGVHLASFVWQVPGSVGAAHAALVPGPHPGAPAQPRRPEQRIQHEYAHSRCLRRLVRSLTQRSCVFVPAAVDAPDLSSSVFFRVSEDVGQFELRGCVLSLLCRSLSSHFCCCSLWLCSSDDCGPPSCVWRLALPCSFSPGSCRATLSRASAWWFHDSRWVCLLVCRAEESREFKKGDIWAASFIEVRGENETRHLPLLVGCVSVAHGSPASCVCDWLRVELLQRGKIELC